MSEARSSSGLDAHARARMPAVPRVGLGVGLDLPHGGRAGLTRTPAGPRIDERVLTFLRRHERDFATLFVSWQPSDRGAPDGGRAAAPFLDLFARAPAYRALGLHHTALNTGAPSSGAADAVLAFTTELVERCGFAWVNEDLGIWSIEGKPLPYPLPPILTPAGLRACIKNVDKVQRALPVPFVVEFPGSPRARASSSARSMRMTSSVPSSKKQAPRVPSTSVT